MSQHAFEQVAAALRQRHDQAGWSGVTAPHPGAFVRAIRAVFFPHFRGGIALGGPEIGSLHAEAERLSAALQIPRELEWTGRLVAALPDLADALYADARFTLERDPAARHVDEVIIAYPGFAATVLHRVANRLWNFGVPLLPRFLAEYAHSRTGVDIHPGATIGGPVCIDHGTGVVIGETSVIGKRVTVYQGVTLGALRVSRAAARSKRHPTIEDDVTIYANATILGGDTVIGRGSVVGGNVWVTRSVPAGSVIVRKSDTAIPADAGDEYTI